jgi:hypothetical protein
MKSVSLSFLIKSLRPFFSLAQATGQKPHSEKPHEKIIGERGEEEVAISLGVPYCPNE